MSAYHARLFGPPPPDPQPGDIWEHTDGGSFYVLKRWPWCVYVQRGPFGDSQAYPYAIALWTFARETTGLIRRAVNGDEPEAAPERAGGEAG